MGVPTAIVILAVGVSVIVGLSSSLEILGPSEVRVSATSNVTLLCVGEGDLVWLSGGVELVEGGHISLVAEGGLILINVSISEVGSYECYNGSLSKFVTISLTSPTGDQASYDMIRNCVVGGMIGMCGLVLVVGLLIYGLALCVHNKDKASHLEDELTYEYKDLYVATLNMDTLDKLDPQVLSKIDLTFLAQLTHTDPAHLAKYQVEPHTAEQPHTPIKEEQDSNSTSLQQVYVDSVDIANHISHRWTSTEPRPLTHRDTVITMETSSPTPKKHLRKKSSAKSFTSIDGSRNGENSLDVRQDFLRILKMVPLQQEVEADQSDS